MEDRVAVPRLPGQYQLEHLRERVGGVERYLAVAAANIASG
ncbi:hypothetical protein ACVCAH_31115 [Micromonospora sp. LZ34]